MKVAFVSYECPPAAGGGIGTYVQEAARMLVARGHHVEVFAGSERSTGTDERADGLTVHRVAAPDRRKFPALIAPVFADRHRAVGFDILEGPDYMAEAAEARVAAPDVPYVAKLHTSLLFVRQIERDVLGPVGRLQARWKAWRRGLPPDWSPGHPTSRREVADVRSADGVAAPSHSIGQRVVDEWGVDPARVATYPYPFTPAPGYLAVKPGSQAPVVTFVGRLEVRKGVENLARAVPLVRRAVPGARFRFVGGTLASRNPAVTMESHLKRLLARHADAVEFLGRRPPEELPGLLADTAVCASRACGRASGSSPWRRWRRPGRWSPPGTAGWPSCSTRDGAAGWSTPGPRPTSRPRSSSCSATPGSAGSWASGAASGC